MTATSIPAAWEPQIKSIARIIFGFLVFRHGLEHVFDFPVPWISVEPMSVHGVLKTLSLPAGFFIMLGLGTRPLCVAVAVMSILTWVAGPLTEAFTEENVYLGPRQLIWGRGPTDPLLLPALFFIYLAASGPGRWSLDALRNRAAAERQASWAPHSLGVMRIAAGLLFLPHGIEKFPVDPMSLRALAGVLECVGGPMIALGLFTRPVAFVLSGEMAFAYFLNHAPDGFWGSFIEPNQESAILYCFLFLFLWAAGPGSFSVDSVLRKRKS